MREITCVDSLNNRNDVEYSTPSAKIKIDYSGIWGSDIHIIRGSRSYEKLPIILGHEASGTVLEIPANLN